MSIKTPEFKWKQQVVDKDCEVIDCPEYDEYKDFRLDPSGCYVLIRVKNEIRQIEVAVVNKDHKIIRVFRGQMAQQLYHTIFKYEQQHGQTWFIEKDHMAYLGKELKKAQLALEEGNDSYAQE